MNRKFIACILAGAVILSSVSFTASADENNHTVTFIDFNGSVMKTVTVPHGSELDLSIIDTDSLNSHLDIYTQIAFNSWGNLPESNIVTDDIAVYALFRKMVISCDSSPTKTEYFSNKGDIRLDGLSITITDYVQTPEKDKNGAFIVKEEVTNIESKCTTSPSSLDEAFADGKKSADINVYPISSDKAILTYNITYFDSLGDVNSNNFVEATDASSILYCYSHASVGDDTVFTEYQKQCGDINRDGIIDASDASQVLSYYSMVSTNHDEFTWEDFFNQ